MRLSIILGFLSLWLFAIVMPAVVAIADMDNSALMEICHKEKEEKQESEKKDNAEEKMLSDDFDKIHISVYTAYASGDYRYNMKACNHVLEILSPPPEQLG